ncbi:MAG: hypothetical protein WC860_08940 [Candidatus Margulisiibacteriota bacterium]|jgi:hypothetical protein
MYWTKLEKEKVQLKREKEKIKKAQIAAAQKLKREKAAAKLAQEKSDIKLKNMAKRIKLEKEKEKKRLKRIEQKELIQNRMAETVAKKDIKIERKRSSTVSYFNKDTYDRKINDMNREGEDFGVATLASTISPEYRNFSSSINMNWHNGYKYSNF